RRPRAGRRTAPGEPRGCVRGAYRRGHRVSTLAQQAEGGEPLRRVKRLEPAALAGVMSRDVVIFGRYWKATTFSSVMQPTIYLLAFGLGFGTLVKTIGHVKTVEYVGTGVVATAVLFSSA